MRPTPAIDKYIAPLFRTTGEIKRTLKIPSNMNLGYVQEVLMLAMGWEGYHLKEIRHGNYTYFVRLAGGQDPEPVEGFPQRDSFKYTLGDLLKEEWDSFIFVYDLGDAWKHRVTLIDIAPCKEDDAKRIPSTVSLRYFFRGFQNYHPYNEQISWSTANQWPAFFFVEGLAAAYRDRFSLTSARAGRRSERRAPRAGHWCASSSESVDGSDGHSLAGAWQ